MPMGVNGNGAKENPIKLSIVIVLDGRSMFSGKIQNLDLFVLWVFPRKW